MNVSNVASKNWFSLILTLLVAINIFGDIGNIVMWHALPEAQESLLGGFIAEVTGAENALTVGTAILAVVAISYAVALLGLLKKQKWAPLLVIGVSIVNRAIAVFLYMFNEFYFVWFAWSVILLTVAFLDLRKTRKMA